MTQRIPFAPAALVLALGLCGSAAHAVDYSGYFRAGPGATSEDSSRACYGLNGGSSGMKYRLGNECDLYGEFQFAQGFNKDGIDTKVTLMVNHYTNATENTGDGLKIEQLWAEAKGFDIAPTATFWIGKERGRRGDVHIVDTFFVEMMGVGAGVKNIPAGSGKLGFAYYKTDGAMKDAGVWGNRFNAEYIDIAANQDGKLNFFGTITKAGQPDGENGFGLTGRHDQSNLFGMSGLNNVLFLQYAQGTANLNANFGDLTADSDAKGWRIVESVNWQRGAFGGQAMLLGASQTDSNDVRTTSMSLGGRISYAFTKNFKLVTEAAYSQYKTEDMPTAKLAKLTIAPTLATGPDFWSRPEFRLYVTTAKWNAPAGNVTGQAAYADKTDGTSWGAQVEWWF